MTPFRHRLGGLLGTIFLLTLATIAAQPRKDVARKDLEAALHVGKTVVLVVAPATKRAADDESYGDWADALNDFSAHAGAGADVRIFQLTPLRLSQLLVAPRIKHEFAVLFLRDTEHALVYDGQVVERKVYDLGLAYAKGRPDEKLQSSYGLQEKTTRFK